MENESLDSVNEYFKHLGQVTQELNREEIAALWKRIKQGDKEAKNKMMELNLRLVIPTAKRFQRPGMDLMDLIEEGNLGLLQAIDKFEPEKGYRFSTYAVYWIEQYIRKYIEEQSGSIKIPSHAWGNLKKWFRAWNNLKEANGRDPSLNEMAQELNLTARQVKSIMDTLSAAKGVDSLTSLVHDEEELTLEDMISDDGKGNPHDVFLQTENQETIKKSMELLNPRDREILIMRYGLADNEPKTLGEVAEKLGLSRERVRQIEERAVMTLRRAAQKAGILEMNATDFRTRKLHSAMHTHHQKTNILGEVIDRSPLARLIRKRMAEAARAAQQKSAPLKKSAPAKKTSAPAKKASAQGSKKQASTAAVKNKSARAAGKATAPKAVKPAPKSGAKKAVKKAAKKPAQKTLKK
ncbi:MAG: sigma-70 family RNA polymerase sigma factor [Elusimicrobiaceae bacterium]|uniref:sigma-70 family RNA polymerase sigma factor n=1 Tax=Candidatus Avelusimicrobium faecicola TaxID=3416205 RepID=UPI002A76D499|nr:sigma-70 family RNA polymerase sigma factor [Spirochaetota bacterium]MDY2940513.1 sigma-70 family RNA polymerase sigma factor [Elusimicrobiaceae bacterium]